MEITRLAPSPTGALHLGNARSFLINWAMARQENWKILLRIEDLDTPRIKSWAVDQAMEDLSWLGMDWDEGPTYQAGNLNPYLDALNQLGQRGRVYPCSATRREIEAAQSAPNAGDHEARYPGFNRPEYPDPVEVSLDDPNRAWRLRVDPGEVEFHDRFAGMQRIDVDATVGDFVVATKAGLPAYQLAVVVDDVKSGVTQVVRGDDLLNSAGRQLLIYRALSYQPEPTYTHLPLVLGEDGRRLAKRHGDSRLSHYRELGVSPERIIGLLAMWCGAETFKEMNAADFLEWFDLGRVPCEDVVFYEDDEKRYLKSGHD